MAPAGLPPSWPLQLLPVRFCAGPGGSEPAGSAGGRPVRCRDRCEGYRLHTEVIIVVLDEEGQDAARFEVSEAWPCRYTGIDLSAKGNEVAIETLELCNEGIRRIQ